MARFYARFDHGVETTLQTNNLMDRRVISSATASGGNIAPGDPDLKTGLITSRSVLSDAMYAVLDAANRDGSAGVIIPPQNTAGDQPNITRTGGNLTFTNVYKTTGNQIPGVKIPADFSTRPTSSIYTDDGNITAAFPIDGGTISDSLYTAASSAVYAVLSQIKSASFTNNTPFTTDGSPYSRLGNDISRTLHSIYHSASVDLFGWDDFTPGQMTTNGMGIQFNGSDCNPSANTSTIQFTWHSVNSYQFRNDGNGSGQIGIEIRVSPNGPSGTCTTNFTNNYRLQLGYTATTHGGPLTLGTATSGNGPTNPSTAAGCTGTSTWTWNGFGTYNSGGTPNLTWTLKVPDCASPGYNIEVSTKLFDATITTSTNGGQAGIISTDATVPNS
jgi:hypothetical protein